MRRCPRRQAQREKPDVNEELYKEFDYYRMDVSDKDNVSY